MTIDAVSHSEVRWLRRQLAESLPNCASAPNEYREGCIL